MTIEKILEGLKILAGNLLLDGWAWTSPEAKDKAQCEAMVKWLNDTKTNPQVTFLEGGTYYSYATEIAQKIYLALQEKK